jgi:hypothetical protein
LWREQGQLTLGLPRRPRLRFEKHAASRTAAVRRTSSDRKGGHFARRKADSRIVLRESAQTLDADKEALAGRRSIRVQAQPPAEIRPS